MTVEYPTTCPICGDIGGFHLEEVHAAKVTVPRHLIHPEKPEADPGVCKCGRPFAEPGNPCRNPRHAPAAGVGDA